MKLSTLFKASMISLMLASVQNVTAAQTVTPAIDSSIVSEINTKLANDSALSGFHLDVTSHKGVVMLSGKVDTQNEAMKAIELAQSVPEVVDVKSKGLMAKDSHQPFTDSAITAKVKGTYIREKLFGDKDIELTGIKVETTNGIVYLTGKVDTEQQAKNAVHFAQSVSGVKEVKSSLEVSA